MKFKTLYVIAAHACLFCACGEKQPQGGDAPEIKVQVNPAEISVSSTAQEVVMTVNAETDWGVTPLDPWVKTSPTGGIKGETSVTVSIEENKALDERQTALLIRCGSQRLEVPVKQHYKVEGVTINDDALKAALLKALDADGDGVLSTKEAENVTSLDLSDCGLTDISELVKLFPDLESLDLSGNKLTSIDISLLPKLKNLDLSGNDSLTTIYVWSDFTAPAGFVFPEGAECVEPEIYTPAGYRLVWRDEFNDPSSAMPDTKEWWYETAEPGWVNNELQTYVAGRTGDIVTAEVSDGSLKIRAIKDGSRVYSARVNTRDSWTYGYFEARLKLPKGKGTWPAFWMMPASGGSSWPKCGEIDIMEHVGADLNQVSSSIHCQAYYHAINTQKTAARYLKGATDEFHVYALEWTPEFIRSFVDGEQLFYYKPEDHGPRNENTWPFDKPFQLKLNLAWGGDWGGYKGIDESCLPQTYEIDYVRVFQIPE